MVIQKSGDSITLPLEDEFSANMEWEEPWRLCLSIGDTRDPDFPVTTVEPESELLMTLVCLSIFTVKDNNVGSTVAYGEVAIVNMLINGESNVNSF